MRIAVGTTSSKKISYLIHFFIDDEIHGYSVESGVSDQPMTEAETAQGAYNRAKSSLETDTEAELGVGMEGGLQEGIDGLLYYVCVVVIVERTGKQFMGVSGKLPVPKIVSEKVKAGAFFITELKKLTERTELIDQLITREKMFKEAIDNVITAYQHKDSF